MKFNLQDTINILERTPKVLNELLGELPDDWTMNNEGGESWSPFDVLGHLIIGEKTDWITRMNIILEHGTDRPFERFDMAAHFEYCKGKTLAQLLQEFTRLRQDNLRTLKSAKLDEDALDKQGIHPAFGPVKLREMLATWTVHDLGHIAQVSRVMAKQYASEVGPWTAYLGILK